MILMEVTLDEKERIEKDRQKLKEYLEKREKQERCDHDWVFQGRGHKYDYYTCDKCGDFKFD